MNSNHKVIFGKIHSLLREYFNENLKELEDGKYLAIADSGVWISVNDYELTIGYGVVHNHYNKKYDDVNLGIKLFLIY